MWPVAPPTCKDHFGTVRPPRNKVSPQYGEYQGNGMMSCSLKVEQSNDSKEISNVKTIGGGIKATVDPLRDRRDMVAKRLTNERGA